MNSDFVKFLTDGAVREAERSKVRDNQMALSDFHVSPPDNASPSV